MYVNLTSLSCIIIWRSFELWRVNSLWRLFSPRVAKWSLPCKSLFMITFLSSFLPHCFFLNRGKRVRDGYFFLSPVKGFCVRTAEWASVTEKAPDHHWMTPLGATKPNWSQPPSANGPERKSLGWVMTVFCNSSSCTTSPYLTSFMFPCSLFIKSSLFVSHISAARPFTEIYIQRSAKYPKVVIK